MTIPFGILLRTARKEMELTQAELGKQLEVTGSTISCWETQRTHPRFIRLYKLSRVLHVRMGYFWNQKN